MKKQQLLFYLALIMSIMTIQAQNTDCENNLLLNGDFSNATCGGGNAFQSGCVPNWVSTGGSPSLHGYPSNPYAWLWSHGGGGEAIAGGFNFIAGTTYNISFRIKTDGVNDNCTEIIANNSQVFMIATNSAGAITPTPTGDIIVNQPSSAYLGSWVNVTTTFTPTVNYSQLWIYPYKQISDNCQVNLSIDDICITLAPNNQGAYCCEGENLVDNGNFENGLNGITTSYTQTSATYPGEYDVVTVASNFNASVTDHSFCVDPVSYPTNNTFMVVNGKTQQSGSSIIWEQTVSGLEVGKEYKFCANFKDMEQCTFNIFPSITMRAGTNSNSQIVNTNDSDPCDWKNIELCFTATNSSMNLQIELDETGNGDGNDLAIDDISLQQKLDPNYFISVQHQGNNNTITGSLNTISTTDDVLFNAACNFTNSYYWFVYETTNPTASFPTISSSFAWGNNNGSWGSVSPTGTPWLLTTNFPNYVQFNSNKFYVIGMYIPSCCESCYTDSWEYQITYNNNRSAMNTPILSDEMKEEIKSRFVKSSDIKPENEIGNIDDASSLSIYPSPSKNSFTATVSNATIKSVQIISISGQVIYSADFNQDRSEELIDVSKFSSGIYFVNVIDNNKKRHTAKLVKE